MTAPVHDWHVDQLAEAMLERLRETDEGLTPWAKLPEYLRANYRDAARLALPFVNAAPTVPISLNADQRDWAAAYELTSRPIPVQPLSVRYRHKLAEAIAQAREEGRREAVAKLRAFIDRGHGLNSLDATEFWGELDEFCSDLERK